VSRSRDWKNRCGKGNGVDTITSGLEGSWSANPTAWTTQYFDNLFAFNWVKTKTPAGATEWIPDDPKAATLTPDAEDPTMGLVVGSTEGAGTGGMRGFRREELYIGCWSGSESCTGG
jgi:catalase (peroxidase I)